MLPNLKHVPWAKLIVICNASATHAYVQLWDKIYNYISLAFKLTQEKLKNNRDNRILSPSELWHTI